MSVPCGLSLRFSGIVLDEAIAAVKNGATED